MARSIAGNPSIPIIQSQEQIAQHPRSVHPESEALRVYLESKAIKAPANG